MRFSRRNNGEYNVHQVYHATGTMENGDVGNVPVVKTGSTPGPVPMVQHTEQVQRHVHDAQCDLEIKCFFSRVVQEVGFVAFYQPEDQRNDDIACRRNEQHTGKTSQVHGERPVSFFCLLHREYIVSGYVFRVRWLISKTKIKLQTCKPDSVPP